MRGLQRIFTRGIRKVTTMNKQRRKWINELIEKVTALQDEIDEVLQEEQECFDNMPESLQGSERGESAEEAISNLEEALSCIDDCVSNLESAIDC